MNHAAQPRVHFVGIFCTVIFPAFCSGQAATLKLDAQQSGVTLSAQAFLLGAEVNAQEQLPGTLTASVEGVVEVDTQRLGEIRILEGGFARAIDQMKNIEPGVGGQEPASDADLGATFFVTEPLEIPPIDIPGFGVFDPQGTMTWARVDVALRDLSLEVSSADFLPVSEGKWDSSLVDFLISADVDVMASLKLDCTDHERSCGIALVNLRDRFPEEVAFTEMNSIVDVTVRAGGTITQLLAPNAMKGGMFDEVGGRAVLTVPVGFDIHQDVVAGILELDLATDGVLVAASQPMLQAGDADQNLQFDQLDLVMVQQAAKYLTGQVGTWGDGDWDGAPGGTVRSPPQGDGLFNQLDIIAALRNGLYLTGPYSASSRALAFEASMNNDWVSPDQLAGMTTENLLRDAGGEMRFQPVAIPESSAFACLFTGLIVLLCLRDVHEVHLTQRWRMSNEDRT